MNIPIVTTEDREAHPFNSDFGIQMIKMIDYLDNKTLKSLVEEHARAAIYAEIKGAWDKMMVPSWVSDPIFVVNIALDIAVKKGIIKENERIKYKYHKPKAE